MTILLNKLSISIVELTKGLITSNYINFLIGILIFLNLVMIYEILFSNKY